MENKEKIWFITGSSKGFGREFAIAALKRGDKVAASARNKAALDDLVIEYGDHILPLTVDVTNREQVFAAIKETRNTFGRIDVVINNAGYGLFGAVEEITETQLRDQLETNLFGVLHVTQAVLPIMREQQSGHIIQISTVGGVAAFPNLGGYHASKWALEGLTESLAQEIKPFGIDVTLVEPGGFNTDWNNNSATFAKPQPQYDELRQGMLATQENVTIPDPDGVGSAMLKIVDAPQPPLRVFFGEFPLQIIPSIYQNRLDEWQQWADVSKESEGK